MKDLQQGINILNDTIKNNRTHQDYKRVTELAEKYEKIFTGEDVDTLLKRFVKREDEAMFEQRKAMYQSVMPAVADNLSSVFIKPIRSGRVYSSIDFESKGKEKALEEINDRVSTFWEGESDSGVDAYLRARWFDLVKHDPNAFMAAEFAPFDNTIEKARPYPLEYSSKEAINYSYMNGVLDWLICKTPIKYKRNESPNAGVPKWVYVDGYRYIMYLEEQTVVYVEVDPEQKHTDIENPTFITIGTRVFTSEVFNQKSKGVPAKRVGYKLDTKTKGRTCVSVFHSAVPFFMKELKSGSELDLTMALHVFPQKVQYAKRCAGDREKNIPPCKDGKGANGETCPVCNGTGVSDVHTTAQDVLLVPYPKNTEDMFDLDKLLVYKSPDIALVKFQDEYVDRLTEKARKAVFGGTNQTQKSGQQTATELDYAMDDTYDTLTPFAAQYSACWLFFLHKIAVFTDNDQGIKLYHKFPNDFKLKTLQQLFDERKSAKDASLPQHILDAIDIDIQEILYADDKDTLTKIKIKSRFMPFAGKSNEEILGIINNGKTTRYYEVLYTHFEIIFDEIDVLMGDSFYILPYEKQKAVIRKHVDSIIKEIDAQKLVSSPLKIEADEDGNVTPGSTPGESGNALKNSVGGLTGMIEIAKAVASGVYDLDAAIALVSDRFGVTPEEARRQLGTPNIPDSAEKIDKVAKLT